MARHKANITKKNILDVAMRMFVDNGYNNTSAKAISDELGISTGNLTFHYPTKEHLLAKLVELLCKFQWEMMERVVEEDQTSLLAICIELAAMASICEENEIARDFYLSAYTHIMPLELIRASDTDRAKIVYAEYCKNWTDSQFLEAEIIVSGIEYATLMKTHDSPLEERIAGALNAIMMVYHVPEEIRKSKIEKALDVDYMETGRRILAEFKEYIKIEETGGNAYV